MPESVDVRGDFWHFQLSEQHADVAFDSVVRVPWDAREPRSCTSDYWQIAFLHLQVRTNAQERKAERYRNGCIPPNDNIRAK